MTARPELRDLVGPVVVTAAAVLACGPVLTGRGVVLVGDMTFVPEQPWKPSWLGLDGSVPRAVPADAVISVLSGVVPGDLVQKAVLLGVLVLAGLGLLRLVPALAPGTGRLAGLAGAVLYLWNPYVHERLGIGHWGLLLGYAALPWVLTAADRLRSAAPRSWAPLVCWLGVAAFGSPTGGLLAAGLALLWVLGHGRRPLLVTAAASIVVNLPWLVPGMLAAGIGTDPGGVAAFAARADTPFGVVGSLGSFGGIWKQSIVAGERDAALLVGLALLATAAGLAALVRGVRRPAAEPGPDRSSRLLVLAGTGFVLAVLPAWEPGADLVEALVRDVPGAGLLRDSQKWIALFTLAVCIGFALAADLVIRAAVRRGLSGRVVAVGLVLTPFVLLPSLAWGLAGQFDPVRIPADWAAASQALEEVPAGQRSAVVLPFSAYQRFSWNGDRAALDPAIRYFPGRVVTNDQLTVSGDRTVTGDSPAAARIAAALAADAPLSPVLHDLGIRYVVVELTAAGAEELDLPAGRILHDGPEIRLVDVGGAATIERADQRWPIIAADLLALGTFLAAATFLAVHRFLRKPGVIG